MSPSQFIKKIKNFSTISFILPLVTINVCLLIFKFMGTVDIYANFNLNNGTIEYPLIEQRLIRKDLESFTFMSCSKYKYDMVYISNNNEAFAASEYGHAYINSLITENKIKSVRIVPGNIIDHPIDDRCVRNYPFVFSLFDKFSFLERIFAKAKIGNKSGFAQIKNPYLYGEVSISRTARYFPAVLIFKPFIILSAISLFFYWRNNLNLFNELKNNNVLNRFSKSFFYFGVLSCLFLIMHALLLGLDFDSKLFSKIRRLIIILFIFFEILSQILFTKNLFKFREELKKYIKPLILKIKIAFVTIIFITTCVAFAILGLAEPSSAFKHILEWNYFSSLLLYYLLSRLLWK